MVFIHLCLYIRHRKKASDHLLLLAHLLVLLCVAAECVSVYFVTSLSGLFIGIGMLILLFVNIVRTLRSIQRIENERQQQELERKQKQTELLSLQMMQTLSTTIEAKDEYSRGHSYRVAEYAALIAAELGWSSEEIQQLKHAAYLHDIGKIGIPDLILNKPSRLTDDEYNLIKKHTVIGAEILKDITFVPHIVEVARNHHERYDGNGYPDGLSGVEIPIHARITAMADSYDAMTSNRSYRYALPQKIVRDEMEKGKGSQFDPDIAEVMLSMIDEDEDYNMRQVEKMVSNILVVDDEKINIRLIENICKNEPLYKVIAAESGKQAIDIVGNQQIDLVLLDIEMPDMDGFQTLEEIRKITDVPVIFVTAYKDYKLIERARQMGVEDYITKPFLPIVFLETLYGVIG